MSLSSYINHCNFNEININYTNDMVSKNNNYYSNSNNTDKDNNYFRVINPEEQQELNKNVINSCGDDINSSHLSYESDVLQSEQFHQEFIDDKLINQQKSFHYQHQHNNQYQQDTYEKQQLSISNGNYDYKTFKNVTNEFSTLSTQQNEQQSIDVLMQQQKYIYQQQQHIFNKLQQQQQAMHHNEQLQDDYSLQQLLQNNQQYCHPNETQHEEQKLIYQQYEQKQQDVILSQQIYSQNSHTNNDHKKDNCTLFLQCNIQQQQYIQSTSSQSTQIQPSTIKPQDSSTYHQIQPNNISQITNINFPVFINNYDKNNINNNDITMSEQRKRKSNNGGSNDSSVENVKGNKRCRQTYTNTQTKILEKTFSITQYVTREKRMDLANAINLSEGQIKVWFQNRRMKEKSHGNKL